MKQELKQKRELIGIEKIHETGELRNCCYCEKVKTNKRVLCISIPCCEECYKKNFYEVD